MLPPFFRSPRVMRFIEEASRPGVTDATDAALEAGYARNSISETTARLLAQPAIVDAIQRRIQEHLAKTVDVSPEMVIQHWLDIALADPQKIVRVRKLNCRHCNGILHNYEWTPWEFAEAAATAMDQGEKLPDMAGGMNYKFNADPHPDCPRCHGEGVHDVYYADMSTLGPRERKLIAGIKQTKDGLEIRMHDQAAAWDNLRDYMGMKITRGELTGRNGKDLIPGGKLEQVVEALPTDAKALELMYRDFVTGAG